MNTQDGDLNSLIQERIDSDTEFQESISNLEDDEREQTIQEKKQELINQEYSSLVEKSKKDAELANNYKIRAEKAEKKTPKKETKEDKWQDDSSTISQQDIITLSRAEIDEDDIPEVLEYAKFKSISIKEALNSSILKATLKEKEEERKTAQAMNVKTQRPGQKGASDPEILKKLSDGEIPKAGSKEAEDAFWAKRGGRR